MKTAPVAAAAWVVPTPATPGIGWSSSIAAAAPSCQHRLHQGPPVWASAAAAAVGVLQRWVVPAPDAHSGMISTQLASPPATVDVGDVTP